MPRNKIIEIMGATRLSPPPPPPPPPFYDYYDRDFYAD